MSSDESSPTSSPSCTCEPPTGTSRNGSPAMAVEHLLNTTERDRCVQLVTALVLPTYQAGQMSTVQRWLSALGDAADRGVSPARRAGRLHRAVHRADRRSATVGGDRRRRLVRPGAGRRHGVVRLGAGDVPRRHVRRRPRADADRRELRGRTRSRRGAHGATRRSASAPRRICSPATSTRPLLCSRRRPRWPPRCPTPTRSSTARPSSRVLAMDRGRWAEAAEHVERALAAIDEHRMHDYATSVLAFAGRGPACRAPRAT